MAILAGLKNNPFDLIERNRVVAAVVQFRRARAFVRRHLGVIAESVPNPTLSRTAER